jgi:hypothetical protein
LEIHVLIFDRHKNGAELNRLMGPNRPLVIIGTPTAIQIKTNDKKKSAHILFHLYRYFSALVNVEFQS